MNGNEMSFLFAVITEEAGIVLHSVSPNGINSGNGCGSESAMVLEIVHCRNSGREDSRVVIDRNDVSG
jgi:hypothetical protein